MPRKKVERTREEQDVINARNRERAYHKSFSEERYQARLEYNREWRRKNMKQETPEEKAKRAAKRRAVRATPEGKLAENKRVAAWRAKNRDKIREYAAKWRAEKPDLVKAQHRRRYVKMRAGKPLRLRIRRIPLALASRPLAGSVIAASVPSPHRDMLVSLLAAVPRSEDREDIVSEAAMLMLEGMSQAEALKQAGKNVRKDVYHLRNARQIEDCYWL